MTLPAPMAIWYVPCRTVVSATTELGWMERGARGVEDADEDAACELDERWGWDEDEERCCCDEEGRAAEGGLRCWSDIVFSCSCW